MEINLNTKPQNRVLELQALSHNLRRYSPNMSVAHYKTSAMVSQLSIHFFSVTLLCFPQGTERKKQKSSGLFYAVAKPSNLHRGAQGEEACEEKKIKMMTAIIWLKPAPFYLLPTVRQDELKTEYLLLSINRINQSRVKA